jgi:prepilin-type N-terminal cleavage/methylation domain-containing protein
MKRHGYFPKDLGKNQYMPGRTSRKLYVSPASIKAQAKPDQGFSLVEVLVALVFVSLAIVMFTYFVDAFRINRAAKQETVATLYAKDYIEGLRAKWRSLEGYQNLSLAKPQHIPAGYELEVKIKNEKGHVVYGYPGSASGEDDSLLRILHMTFTDTQDKTLSFQSVMARPTPVYPDDDNDRNDDDEHEDM